MDGQGLIAEAAAVVPQAKVVEVPASAAPAKAPLVAFAKVPSAINGFDLGALKPVSRVQPPKPSLAKSAQVSRGVTARPAKAHGHPGATTRMRDRIEGDIIFHQAKVSFDDRPDGSLSVRIGAGGDLSLRIGDLLSLYEPGMAPAVFTRLSGSSAAGQFVSFETLRSAGIDIRYDAGSDQLKIATRD